MIKGVNRQVVEVSDTGSEYFERILFIVKPEYATVSEGKVRERVEQIAQATGAPPPTKAKTQAPALRRQTNRCGKRWRCRGHFDRAFVKEPVA